MKAKQYLEQMKRINAIIKSNQEELKAVRETITCVSGIDYSNNTISSNNFQSEANFVNEVLDAIELEEVIKADINKCIKLKEEIRNTINNLDNPTEKLLLRLRYINLKEWADIDKILDVSIRTRQRIFKEALNNIEIPS